MAFLLTEQTPAGRRWRVRWREGGRGSKFKSSERFDDKSKATAALRLLQSQEKAGKKLRGRVLIPWGEVRERWLATKAGRYQDEARRTMERHTGSWSNTLAATPSAMKALPLGTFRVVKACLRWADFQLGQAVDAKALRQIGTRRIPKRAKPPLLTDEEVRHLVDAASKTSRGNWAITHLIATYGHRPESLVRLTAKNFKDGCMQLTVKGGDILRHALLDETLAIIRPLLDREGAIFLNHLGKPWDNGRAFSSWFYHSFGVGNKQIKRAAISRWLALGADPKTIASITGHRTVSLLLDAYAATNATRQAAALSMLRRDTGDSAPAVIPVDLPILLRNTSQ